MLIAFQDLKEVWFQLKAIKENARKLTVLIIVVVVFFVVVDDQKLD